MGRELEIVGHASDVETAIGSAEIEPLIYIPLQQAMTLAVDVSTTLIVATEGPASEALPALLGELGALDPKLAVPEMSALEHTVSQALLPQRMGSVLLSSLSGLTLLLTLLGIYGVVSFAVSQRRHEIGIRLALGSSSNRLLVLIAGAVLRPVGLGLAAGLVLAIVASRFVSAFLYGIEPTDSATFATAVLAMAGVAAIAAYLPGRRIGALDPAEVLRSE